MAYSNWDRAADKERARQELRDAREEILKKAEKQASYREEQKKRSELRGDDKWMLPSVSEKINKIISKTTTSSSSSKKSSRKKTKKEKKSKKEKKPKKRKKYSSSSNDDDSSSEEEKIRKKKRKKRKMSTSSSSSDSDSKDESPRDEWIEKSTPLARDDWMAGMSLNTFDKPKPSKKEKEQRVGLDAYDPGKSTRELNPHWKNGGTGVPTFKKPNDSDHEDEVRSSTKFVPSSSSRGNWRKNKELPNVTQIKPKEVPMSSSSSSSGSENDESNENETKTKEKQTAQPVMTDFLTDQQMNELGAKLIKAEIMGNDSLVSELKEKLDRARNYRENHKTQNTKQQQQQKQKHADDDDEEHIVLTTTNQSGLTRPLEPARDPSRQTSNKKRGTKTETHRDNERIRYFPDDDKYNLKTMFEREKFTTAADQEAEFVRIAGSHKNKSDDIEDIFSDQARRSKSDAKLDEKARSQAIREHQEMERTLENCDRCFDSRRMQKQLIVAMGRHIYLSLPSHEGLQTGHCIIAPFQHFTCSTQLDEDVWNEINDFLKALTRMFTSRKQDVVFFETARYLHRKPHMLIHCVPSGNFELLPFYFKKAIQESESDWAVNKQLVTLKGDRKDLRRSIPKGLPYFWVNFGVDSGFAHVIEDQEKFPGNFAQETIGGLLNLDSRLWRRPRKIENMISKVKQFAEWWKPFDLSQDE